MSNMKIGLAGWGFREMTIREYFDTASRLGLSLVELNCRPDVPNHAWVDFDKQDITEVQDCAADEGIEIIALAANNDFSTTDPSALNSQVAQIRRTIELARELGAPYVRTVIGPDEQSSPAVLELALRRLQEAAQFANSFDIHLAIENGQGPLASAQQCQTIMEQLAAEPIGLVYNPAGFARQGDDPLKALELLGEYVCYAHLCDWDGQDCCPIGKGNIDWEKIMTLLDESDLPLALIEYPHPQDIELGTAASYKKLTSLLRKLGPRPT